MSVRLCVCLVFIAEIVTSHYNTTSQYEDTSKYINYNERNIRKIVTDTLNESAGGAAIDTNKTGNSTVIPLNKDKDKNATVTKKPEADKYGMETQSTQIVDSYPPYSSYQVTENVIDIPDDRTKPGPIDINYTPLAPILNTPRPTNKTDTTKATEAPNATTKKNRISIFHFSAEFDGKEPIAHENKVVGLLKGIKAYLYNLQKGVVKGIHSFFHKHEDDHKHGEKCDDD